MLHKNLIAGEWVSGDASANINPSNTSDVVGDYARASAEDTKSAIAAAKAALPTWSRSGILERHAILKKVGDEIIARREELGRLLAREEIFGPVAAVIRVKDYDEALAVANDTSFGLSSGIATTSLKHATHFKRNSEAGMVMVNLPTAGVDFHVPFGGRKGSSYGPREQGRYAAEFYTTVKTAYTLA